MKDLFRCNEPGCNKMYVNSAILKRHVQAFHSTFNKFECAVCKKSLASRQNLKEHSFIHTGEKPYACNYPGCTMSFRQGTHLSAHKKNHQKITYCIDLKVFMEKLAKDKAIEENAVILGEFLLPEFKCIQEIPVLPSLFL